jgi:SAM-dependent methyltransferase
MSGIIRGARRYLAHIKQTLLKFRLGERWLEQEGTARRAYQTYDDYLRHQRNKFDAFSAGTMARYDRQFYAALSDRLASLPVPLLRRSVLCLAARQGTEVRAFIDQGAFAIGIDLNPGKKNPYVLPGDFHNLQFAPGSVDVVYTNALDHAYDLERLLLEVKRVLAADGVFVVEGSGGAEAESGRGFYESLAWSSTQRLLGILQQYGFALERRTAIQVPWLGEQFVLRKT